MDGEAPPLLKLSDWRSESSGPVQRLDGNEVSGHRRAKLVVKWRRAREAVDTGGDMRGFTSFSPSLLILLSIPSQANPTSSLPST
ncbi:unnamed protein product [Linum trigynum]|uniref:Uncharacterized protein n=1 Tax=Linum trigynum TaxID=586398 RepID=A0AAV2DUH4_9ROSI